MRGATATVERAEIERWLGSACELAATTWVGGARAAVRVRAALLVRLVCRMVVAGSWLAILAVALLWLDYPMAAIGLGSAATVSFALSAVTLVCLMLGGVSVRQFVRRHGDEVVRPPVQANGSGLLVGGLIRRRVDWWQVVSVEQGADEWLVRSVRGDFTLPVGTSQQRRVAAAVLAALEARAQGRRLPDEPDRTPAGALSRCDLEEAAVISERGLSRPGP